MIRMRFLPGREANMGLRNFPQSIAGEKNNR
jgi:hypothetical protein